MVSRVLIVSPQADRVERLLLRDARFYVQDALCSTDGWLQKILKLCPDLLVWESAVSPDGIGLYSAAPPRIVWLYPEKNAVPDAAASIADRLLPLPAEDTAILSTIAEAALFPHPSAAQYTEAWRTQYADDLLETLGMPEKLKGRGYIRACAAACACSPMLLFSLRDVLYPFIADMFSATPSAVERAVRTAIEATWLRGDLEGIQRLFGLSVDANRGKPTNKEFLSAVAQQVRQRVQRHLQETAERFLSAQ